MSLPDFLCIGAQRAGTTWLYQMLSQHPEIFMTAQKELHFFDEKPDFSDYAGLGNPGRPLYYDMNSPAHWRWYSQQFKEGKKQKAKGEITPFYATLSEKRIELIAKKLPHLKIIYILRNPVKRAWSSFNLFLQNQNLHLSRLPDTELINKTIMHPTKLIHGDYQRNIGVWERSFNCERILYLFYDDICLNPQKVLNRIFVFLNIDQVKYDLGNISTRFNTIYSFEMPKSIEYVLTKHFENQISFIQTKFNHILVL